MSNHCNHAHPSSDTPTPAYRRVLWVALLLNAAMFFIEFGAGLRSGSVSLLADAIDFFGDAANYGVSLAVLGLALSWRSRAALLKALCMMGFGVWVLGRTLWSAGQGITPNATVMTTVALLAMAVNIGVAVLLYRFRNGDANRRSVWLCSRNDAVGNLAVVAAGLGVFGTQSGWPDLAVAVGIAALALSGGWAVFRQARVELKNQRLQ
jgi:Co/Zn/Cd efflux system component